MRQLGRIDKLDLGIAPSMPHSQAPLWVDGNGIIFQEECVQPEPGQVQLFERLRDQPITALLEARLDPDVAVAPFTNKKNVLIFMDLISINRWEDQDSGTTLIDAYDLQTIKDATLDAPAGLPTLLQWGNSILVVGPIVNGVRLYTTTSPTWTVTVLQGVPGYLDLDARGPQVATIFRNHFIVMNTREGADLIFWNSADSLADADWTPTRANTSGQLVAKDIEGPIVAALPLGDGVGFYGSGSMHLLSFLGAPFVFGERQVHRNVGCVGKHALASVGRLHYGFGPRGLWRSSGQTVEYIDKPWIHDFIFADLNQNQWSKSIVIHNTAEELVEFHYPTADSLVNNRCVGFHPRLNLWTIKNFARSAGSPAELFDRPIFGSPQGNIYMQSTEVSGASTVGAPLTLSPTWTAPGFYGEMGYGTGGYGGHGGDG